MRLNGMHLRNNAVTIQSNITSVRRECSNHATDCGCFPGTVMPKTKTAAEGMMLKKSHRRRRTLRALRSDHAESVNPDRKQPSLVRF